MNARATLVFTLLGSAAAQSTPVVSPPGFDTVTGGNRSWGIAAFPNGRSQLADGELRSRVLTLNGLSFRLYAPAAGYHEPGRKFTSVTLDMSEADIAKMSATFSTNLLRTPTRVFQSPVALPFVTGPSPSTPAPWSLHFPFGSSWIYTGALDLLADFSFAGGTLDNAAAWTTHQVAYMWDTPPGKTVVYPFLQKEHGNTNTSGCVDSGSTVPSLAGRAVLRVINHNPADPFHPLAGRLLIEQGGSSFGAGARAVLACGLRSLPSGVPFPGVTCNRLHVDTSLPMVLSARVANPIGSVPTHHPVTGAGGVPFQTSWVGQTIVVQGAWNDTGNGNLLLSTAREMAIPANEKLFRLASVHGPGTVTGTAYGDSYGSPVRRYTR